MSARKQDEGFDVDQSSNVKVLARTRRRTTGSEEIEACVTFKYYASIQVKIILSCTKTEIHNFTPSLSLWSS
jgi:hypothetical protein